MRVLSLLIGFLFISLALNAQAQNFSIKGKVHEKGSSHPAAFVNVGLKGTNNFVTTDEQGRFLIRDVAPGTYTIIVSSIGYNDYSKEITVIDKDIELNVSIEVNILEMDTVVINKNEAKTFGITRLRDVEGTSIYAGKKTEVIVMKDIDANTATNNSRQIYSKIPGLNIWESDGAGIQLGIGGRGLNPNRVSNFNTRQNGYDISADALGYPESYYSPPTEALERIEIVRGAASLQYGTQFGGMINFVMQKGPADKKIQWTSRETAGSFGPLNTIKTGNFGLLNTYNSLGGTIKKVNYLVFYQNKSGNGWRPNSEFNVNTAYASLIYKANSRLSLTVQYTFMDYLAHQPGGLTDDSFYVNPRQSVRARNWFKVNWNLGAFILDYSFNEKLKLNSRFFGLAASRSALGVLSFINRPDLMQDRDLWTDKYNNWGNETRLLYYYKVKNMASTLVVGMRYYSGHTDRVQGLGNNGSSGNKSDFQFINAVNPEFSKYVFPNHNIAFFAENILYVTPKFSVIPGIRYEYIRTNAIGYYNLNVTNFAGKIISSTRVDENRTNGRSFLIGGIGFSYKKSANMEVYANISQNYRSINFNDMRTTNPNLVVDPNLKDERGYSADIGLRGNKSKILIYDLSLFMLHYNNRIDNVMVSDFAHNTYNFRTNVSDARIYGVETFAEVDVWRFIKGEDVKSKLGLYSNLSLIDGRYVKSKQTAFENKEVQLVPRVMWKAGLNFKRKNFSASYQYAYTSQQFTDATNAPTATFDAVNGPIPAYYVMDFTAQYSLKRYWTIIGTINNITNNMYFTRRADSYPGPGIIPSDGRAFYLTLQVRI